MYQQYEILLFSLLNKTNFNYAKKLLIFTIAKEKEF